MPFSDRHVAALMCISWVCVCVCEWGLIVARARARPHSNGQQQPGKTYWLFYGPKEFPIAPKLKLSAVRVICGQCKWLGVEKAVSGKEMPLVRKAA